MKALNLCSVCGEQTPSTETCPVCLDSYVCSIACMRKHAQREQKRFLSMSPYERDMLIARLEKEEEARERLEAVQIN